MNQKQAEVKRSAQRMREAAGALTALVGAGDDFLFDLTHSGTRQDLKDYMTLNFQIQEALYEHQQEIAKSQERLEQTYGDVQGYWEKLKN